MSPKNSNESNLPEQLSAWNAGKNPLGKLGSLLRLEKNLRFSPGEPVVYQNSQAVVIGMAGDGQRLIQTPSGQRLAVSVDDLEPIARNFAGAEGAEQR